ncbi:amidohydrolase family protein [Leucobacter rhizosphaerae]|uniref:Amidohydrolase family protein n=1 Tax=Leucobacter rhizosphaerae TaxID=2932245 RepID=A0ABY4FU84_9MICO|nr:amidohydrolase family protein [Leucobacter rhizosphaerae]UOQ59854.1 amidohydrolase family protein [Leucobacter rhizosphaerae]
MTLKLFSRAQLLTLSNAHGDAVLVDSGRISGIGSREDLLASAGRQDVEEVDMDGAVLMPGFVDGHTHLELSCITQEQHLQMHAPPVTSLVQILEEIRQRRATQPDGWIVVRSSFALDRKVVEGRLLGRDELDSVSPDAPVVVLAGLHVASLNTVGMRAVQLEMPERLDPGMTVHRGRDGRPSGIFTEVWDRLPAATEIESYAALRRHAHSLVAAHGITSLCTIPTSVADVRALHALRVEDQLPFRVRFYPHVPRVGPLSSVLSLGAPSGFGDSMLQFGGVKIFVDGEGGDGLGAEFDDVKWTEQELSDLVGEATASRVQLFMHAVTGTGIRAAMAAVAQHWGSRPLRAPAPHRIEHSGDYVPRELIADLAQSGIGVVATPHFVGSDDVGDDFQPLRKLIDAGVRVIGATDSTGTVPSGAPPLSNIASAVTRRDAAGNPSPHRISAEHALRMFTDWAARGQGEGGKKGVLQEGALADFAILDANPLKVSPEDIAGIRVLGTVLNGARVG